MVYTRVFTSRILPCVFLVCARVRCTPLRPEFSLCLRFSSPPPQTHSLARSRSSQCAAAAAVADAKGFQRSRCETGTRYRGWRADLQETETRAMEKYESLYRALTPFASSTNTWLHFLSSGFTCIIQRLPRLKIRIRGLGKDFFLGGQKSTVKMMETSDVTTLGKWHGNKFVRLPVGLVVVSFDFRGRRPEKHSPRWVLVGRVRAAGAVHLSTARFIFSGAEVYLFILGLGTSCITLVPNATVIVVRCCFDAEKYCSHLSEVLGGIMVNEIIV